MGPSWAYDEVNSFEQPQNELDRSWQFSCVIFSVDIRDALVGYFSLNDRQDAAKRTRFILIQFKSELCTLFFSSSCRIHLDM